MVDALWISMVGMGITFLAIMLLWGMMAGLTVLPFKDNGEGSPEPARTDDSGLKAKAAAVAAAIALAEQKLSAARPLLALPSAPVSPWQLSTRSRQFYEKGKQC